MTELKDCDKGDQIRFMVLGGAELEAGETYNISTTVTDSADQMSTLPPEMVVEVEVIPRATAGVAGECFSGVSIEAVS